MRAFVAVGLPAPGLDIGRRPTTPSHLTLAFLGEVPNERTTELVEAVRRGSGEFAAFRVTMRGLGAFPSPPRPRVLWIGIADGATELVELARRIRGELAESRFGFDERPFVPHVTLLRVRSGADAALARRLLDAHASDEFGSAEVDAVELKESHLTSSGAAHRTVERFPLRAGTS